MLHHLTHARVSGLLLLGAFLGWFSVASVEAAPQDDIFGEAAGGGFDGGLFPTLDAPPATQNVAGGARATFERPDPFIEQMRALAGGSPDQIALALREVIRNRLWDEVKLYLTSSRANALTADELATVARGVGGLFLNRAAGASTELGAAATQKIEAMRAGLIAAATDEASLDAAIVALGSGNADDELAAGRTLLRGGPLAMQKVLGAAVSPQPPAPLHKLVQLLQAFQRPAVEATFQLAIHGDNELRPGALRVLIALDKEAATTAYLGALHARGLGIEESRIAEAGLKRLGAGTVTAEQAVRGLATRLREAESHFGIARAADTPVSVWRVREDRRNADQKLVPRVSAAAAKSADLAELLRRQGALSASDIKLAMGAVLRHRYLTNPAFGEAGNVNALQEQWGRVASDITLIGNVLKDSLGTPLAAGSQQPDIARAVGAIRLLGALKDPAAVQGEGAGVAPLVDAVSHWSPRVRYEAASAVGLLRPQESYAGSQRVFDRWIEMSRLDHRPRALMLINARELASSLEERLADYGYEVRRVRKVADLLQAVDQGGDLQLVITTSRPPDYSAVELVDRIRRRPFGGMVPVIMVGPVPAGFESLGGRWVAPTVLIDQPADRMSLGDSGDPAVLASQAAAKVSRRLAELHLGHQLEPLTAGDRRLFAIDGSSNLARLADEPKWDQVYAWRQHEHELSEAARLEGYSESGIKVLSGLGSTSSQALLADLAANPTMDEAIRRGAAGGFVASVERYGTRLTRTQVLTRYDQFNAANDQLTRELIGMVLDAIEARAGVSSKPSNE